MSNMGKNFFILAVLVAAGSLGTNALLLNRYTPKRPVLRFGDGNAVTRGAYQDALESADVSGDVLDHLIKNGENNRGGIRTVSNAGADGLKGRILQVADVDMPMPVRVRRAKPKRRMVRAKTVAKKPKQRVAGISLRPHAKPPVSAMDSSRVANRLRPTAALPAAKTVSETVPLSFAGPGAVEPNGVVAGFPADIPGATVFSQVGPGATLGSIARNGSTIFGGIGPYLVGGSAVVGAIVANNNGGTPSGNTTTGGTTTGGTPIGGTTTGGTATGGTATGGTDTGGSTTGTTGGTDTPAVPEPAPVALATVLTLGIAGLMVRARRKVSEA